MIKILRTALFATVVVAGVGLAPAISAQATPTSVAIDFEAPMGDNDYIPADVYGELGVSITDAFGIVKGVSQGDPGDWGLEGPDGPQFLGQNTNNPVTIGYAAGFVQFSIECSRSNGSGTDDPLTATGYDATDAVVDTMTVTLGEVNTWSTLSLSGAGMVRVVLDGPSPWGCDALLITTSVPETTTTTTATPADVTPSFTG